ncbi:hypothetical protein KFE25_005834 [Diacronema lutheri]|uniref:Uncharacterized protein n=1 Tax=Diacronema lutheri TaxID=2081491 RepID=A0A8J5XRX9_DIALT|nr:hypothetical protein KFE25_005834 [Diacronema lutheri]
MDVANGDIALLLRHERGAGGSASAFPRHASLIVALVLVSRVSFARRLGSRLASRVASAGTALLEQTGWVRREGCVCLVNLLDKEEMCGRALAALERAAHALPTEFALSFAQLDDLRDEPKLPMRAHRHPAREPLRCAHAIAVVFDMSDTARLLTLKARVVHATLLADRHKRVVPLLLLGMNADRADAATLSDLRALLGPVHASAAPWSVVRVLFAGRHSATSPFRLLPDDLICAIALRLHVGSAWGAPFALGSGGTVAPCAAPRAGERHSRPVGIVCWEALSCTLALALPNRGPGVDGALAHAVQWLAGHVEATASWAWSGPWQPMEVTWAPALGVTVSGSA